MWQHETMFDGHPESIGLDCCADAHGDWELQTVGKADHGRATLTFTCSGCGCTTLGEAYRDDHNRWTYTDPDGNVIKPETYTR